MHIQSANHDTLSEAKVLISSRYSGVKLLAKLLIALILRKIELVEARVAGRQLVLARIVAVNVELGEAIHALQLLEAIQRDLARAGDELQKFSALFFIEALASKSIPRYNWAYAAEYHVRYFILFRWYNLQREVLKLGRVGGSLAWAATR